LGGSDIMYKIIIIILITVFLSGCGICNLDNFVVPNDIHFLECVNELDTVPKIAQYMENFTYEIHTNAYTPYQMWKYQIGDCNDYAAFGVFAAKQHNIEAYQVLIWYTDCDKHMNAVYKVGDYWVLTDCWVYHEKFLSIEHAIGWHSIMSGRTLIRYEILGGNKWIN